MALARTGRLIGKGWQSTGSSNEDSTPGKKKRKGRKEKMEKKKGKKGGE